MKKFVLDDSFFEYIENNFSADVLKLRLSKQRPTPKFPLDFALTQIEARRKTSRKLPWFNAHRRFLYPTLLSAEQATNQWVATYHSSLIGEGSAVLDLTAGLGIDALSLARDGKRVIAIELDPLRSKALAHNTALLSADLCGEFQPVEGDSLQYLAEAPGDSRFDWIFIDPARRADDNRRTYYLADCTPDVVANYDLMSRHADAIMIKASPILDISSAIADLPDVAEIHVVCFRGECKEVLIICRPNRQKASDSQSKPDPICKVVDLAEAEGVYFEKTSEWTMRFGEASNAAPIAEASDIAPGRYLYDPNAGLHKLNCAAALCARFKGLRRVAPNSDLYVGERLYSEFPGRAFEIDEIPDKRGRRKLRGEQYEVIARNYPQRADALRTVLGVRSGSDRFVIACRAGTAEKPLLLLTHKLGLKFAVN